MNRVRDRIRGCLLGGATGDALGAPVEFMSLHEIRALYGPQGIAEFAPAYGLRGAVTDDTQLTLFTAEGLLRAHNRAAARGVCGTGGVVYNAYERWYVTQGGHPAGPRGEEFPDGWLVRLRRLHARRAPGNTCLSAVAGGRAGTFDSPANDSKGCGAVMRSAPVGLAIKQDTFRLACEIGALTHGHPSGYLPAGVVATIVAGLVAGQPLQDAYATAVAELRRWPGHEETLAALERATVLARRTGSRLTPEDVERLGGGWTGDSALAISLACCLSADDFMTAVRRAVNHSGDSDSTGSLAGQLWGAAHGAASIPARLLEQLELRDVIQTVADDLYRVFHAHVVTEEHDGTYDWARYPGW